MKRLLLVMGMVGCGEEIKTVDASKLVDRGDGLRYVGDSEFTGVAVSKYENGQKKWEGTYKDGKREGLLTSWHTNGQKRREGTWKDGKKVSETKWDEEGNEIK